MHTATINPMTDIMQRIEENKLRHAIANALARKLRGLGIAVQRIDIGAWTPSENRPRLYLHSAPPTALPLRGITRRLLPDGEVVECAAILGDCEIVWTEVVNEVAA